MQWNGWVGVHNQNLIVTASTPGRITAVKYNVFRECLALKDLICFCSNVLKIQMQPGWIDGWQQLTLTESTGEGATENSSSRL